MILSRLAGGMPSVSQSRGCWRERQMNNEAGTGGGLPLERAADGLQPFAHAAQAVALRHRQRRIRCRRSPGCKHRSSRPQANAAALRLGVAHDVGHRLTNRQGEHRFLRRTEWNLGSLAVHA